MEKATLELRKRAVEKLVNARRIQYPIVEKILGKGWVLKNSCLVEEIRSVVKENGSNPAYEKIENNMRSKMVALTERHREFINEKSGEDKEKDKKPKPEMQKNLLKDGEDEYYKEAEKITQDYSFILKELLLDRRFRAEIRVLDKALELTTDKKEKHEIGKIIDSECAKFEKIALEKRNFLIEAEKLAKDNPRFNGYDEAIKETPVSKLLPIAEKIRENGFSEEIFQ